MYKIIFSVLFGLFQVLGANQLQPKLCVRVRQNCEVKDPLNCGIAYKRFKAACDLKTKPLLTRRNKNRTYLIVPTRKPCSKDCVEAIEALRKIKRGKELDECDCQLDGDCLIVKARVAKCSNKTDQRHKVSCTMAMWNCSRDPTCKFLQSKFFEDCTEMINGVRCDAKCLKIQVRLFNSTYGKPLADCECDGTGEAYCRAMKAHAKQLRCIPDMNSADKPRYVYTGYTATV